MYSLVRCRQFGAPINVHQLVLKHKLAKFICSNITPGHLFNLIFKVPQLLSNLCQWYIFLKMMLLLQKKCVITHITFHYCKISCIDVGLFSRWVDGARGVSSCLHVWNLRSADCGNIILSRDLPNLWCRNCRHGVMCSVGGFRILQKLKFKMLSQ